MCGLNLCWAHSQTPASCLIPFVISNFKFRLYLKVQMSIVKVDSDSDKLHLLIFVVVFVYSNNFTSTQFEHSLNENKRNVNALASGIPCLNLRALDNVLIFNLLSFLFAAKVCNQWQRNSELNNEQWTDECNPTLLFLHNNCIKRMYSLRRIIRSYHDLPILLGGGGGDETQHRPSYYYILLTHSLRLDICQNAIMRYNRRLEARFLFLWWWKIFAHDG